MIIELWLNTWSKYEQYYTIFYFNWIFSKHVFTTMVVSHLRNIYLMVYINVPVHSFFLKVVVLRTRIGFEFFFFRFCCFTLLPNCDPFWITDLNSIWENQHYLWYILVGAFCNLSCHAFVTLFKSRNKWSTLFSTNGVFNEAHIILVVYFVFQFLF